jgi:NAD(P)-dependent dehydrogenase (short-subunit alcohol dehydrogenase family)
MRIEGKTALVTGAGSGIGQAVARRFAREGARVVAADIRLDAAEKTAAELGEGASALAIDVADRASSEAGVAEAVDRLGSLDVLVNVAGVTIVGGVFELTEEEWDKEIDTNLKSIYLMSKAAWPTFLSQGGGSIVSIASDAAFRGLPQDAAYCASKAGVAMLTKCMALDGAVHNIRANCVCPGFINTPMLDGYFEDQPDPAASRAGAVSVTPLGRLGSPDDIAAGVLYLASDDANWVSGTPLIVDGGFLAGLWSN